jgi:hypothetical protein
MFYRMKKDFLPFWVFLKLCLGAVHICANPLSSSSLFLFQGCSLLKPGAIFVCENLIISDF